MDERLDQLADILKSYQMFRIIAPVETNQPLSAQSDIIFNQCGMNVHELSECSPSHYISTCGASQLLNSVPRKTYDSVYTPEAEESNGMGANTFQTRAISGKF